jgi:hypothetical protein
MKCRLCLKDKLLCNSHIIPEFFFRPTYDEKHRTQEINLKVPNDINLLQKGYREKLLCDDCEQFINANYELYFNNIWYEKGYKPKKISRKKITLPGIDYSKFKLFLLSILWRASISTHKAFSLVNIGVHEEILRERLLNNDAGSENDYPIYSQFILYPNSNYVFDGLIISPITQIINKNEIALFVFGGCSWFFFYNFLLEDKNILISKKGKVTFGVKPFEELRIISEPLFEMKNKGLI